MAAGSEFRLTSMGAEGTPMWAYRYRVGDETGRRVPHGGFANEEDARAALERALEIPAASGRSRRHRRPSESPIHVDAA